MRLTQQYTALIKNTLQLVNNFKRIEMHIQEIKDWDKKTFKTRIFYFEIYDKTAMIDNQTFTIDLRKVEQLANQADYDLTVYLFKNN